MSVPLIDAAPRVGPSPIGLPSQAIRRRIDGVVILVSPFSCMSLMLIAVPVNDMRIGVVANAKRSGDALPVISATGLATAALKLTVSPCQMKRPPPAHAPL